MIISPWYHPIASSESPVCISSLLIGTLGSCGGAETPSTGISPAQATIWALSTQVALQQIFNSLTLTAISQQPSSTPPPTNTLVPSNTLLPVANGQPLLNNTNYPVVYVKSHFAKARQGPDIRFAGADQPFGITAEVMGQYGDWLFLKFPDGSQGWMVLEWLTIPDNVNLNNVQQFSTDQVIAFVPACSKYCK